MSESLREPVPFRLFARALGFGSACGAMLGVASLAPVVALVIVSPSGLGIVVLYCFCAAVVGGIVGSVVGLLGGGVLVMANADKPGNEWRARRVGGATAAAPFVGLAMLGLTLDPAPWSGPLPLDGWLLVVVVMSVVTGAAVGPRVALGRTDRLPTRSDNRRTRPWRRCSALA